MNWLKNRAYCSNSGKHWPQQLSLLITTAQLSSNIYRCGKSQAYSLRKQTNWPKLWCLTLVNFPRELDRLWPKLESKCATRFNCLQRLANEVKVFLRRVDLNNSCRLARLILQQERQLTCQTGTDHLSKIVSKSKQQVVSIKEVLFSRRRLAKTLKLLV